jgi:hypothetical protein
MCGQAAEATAKAGEGQPGIWKGRTETMRISRGQKTRRSRASPGDTNQIQRVRRQHGSNWKLGGELHPLDEVTETGRRYATLPEGEEKKAALTELCRCFHPYLMKYLVMICRGHLPVKGHGAEALAVNKDIFPFIKLFLPKGTLVNRHTLMVAARHFHLAFKGMGTEEVYDVLMTQLIRAVHKYDPHYTDKVRIVAEAIDNEFLSKQSRFSVADVNRFLESDSNRYLCLLCRIGFLTVHQKDVLEKGVFTALKQHP